jgi:SAM-dependent methyltransferase
MGTAFSVFTKAEIGKFVIRVPAVEAHEVWAPFYDSTPNPLLALARRSLSDLLHGRNGKNVIDIACGTGEHVERLRQTGANVFGLDACGPMLQEAKKRVVLAGRLVQGDASSLPLADRWADLVICSMSLGYFDRLDTIFSEFARVARPGGSIVVSDLHPHAIAAGWTRSFKAASISYEIQHFRYSTEQIREAARFVGLSLQQWSNVRLGWPEFPIFEQADKIHLFEKSTRMPALFLAMWEKP